jgi:hypothetical protein
MSVKLYKPDLPNNQSISNKNNTEVQISVFFIE